MERKVVSPWFMRLRWFAFVGQSLVLAAAVAVFQLTLPWERIVALLLLIPVTDSIIRYTPLKHRSDSWITGALLSFDTVLLTAVLCLAGGPTNPFTIVYLVHVVLSAVLLTPVWTWAAGFLSSLGFAALFFFSIPVPEWENHGAHHGFSLHLHGMFFAYLLVAFLVVYFLSKIVGEVQRSARRLEHLESVAANQQRLASLTTITAGAAHELGTPLATIAVVSHELERTLKIRGAHPDLLDDISLLKTETARCKEIIQELSARTGDLTGETPQQVLVSELLQEAIRPLKPQPQVRLSGMLDAEMRVPRTAVAVAVRALVKNAVEAGSGENDPVLIHSEAADRQISITIKDTGAGMDSETLTRVGSPFFSTKAPGKGMGLGVYLARLTVEQLGGIVRFDSTLKAGTTAVVSLPLDCISMRTV